MSTAQKFMFGADFREGGRRAAGEADLANAKAEAFSAGQAQAHMEAQGQLNGLVAQLARTAEKLLAQEDARAMAVEAQAVQVAVAAARALAGAALADKPLAALERAARECLSHARLAPHLVMRVNESAVEAVESMLKRVAQESAYAGRLVVLGEPDIAPGDGRIEWADGGFAIDSDRLGASIERAVDNVFGPMLSHSQDRP